MLKNIICKRSCNALSSVIKNRNYHGLTSNSTKQKILLCNDANSNLISIHTTSPNYLLWEKDRKGGYDTTIKDNLTNIEHIRNGFKELKSEIKLWTKEIKDKFESDPILVCRPGETDMIWCFDRASELENWVTTSDSDHNQGYSKCALEMSKAGRAIFHGDLDVRVPKDGKIKRAGYCAMRSKRVRKSFKRETMYDWMMYNTLVLKVRGDGRSYLLNLSTEGYWDITWNDIYHYVLYTRGGPYWQIAKIPFSKFILGSKGRLQDKQSPIRLDRVTHFGVSCGDKVNGKFELEIEYIGLEFDPNHNEEFAYEMYKTERYIVGV